ncbi:MAG: hypothetical protein Q8K12_17595 [Thiobacillus sp.]|nr:hypothetical protein [Thiobacillus sp.]
MTIGFRDAGICYETLAEANDAHFSSMPVMLSSAWYDNATGKNWYLVQRYQKTSASGWQEQLSACSKGPGQSPVCATVNTPVATNSGSLSCTLPVAATSTTSTPSEYGLPSDFDYTQLAGVWAFAVSVVVACYILARGMGLLIAMFQTRN